ncbi:MAG TPA: V-type ATP synthase subunit A [Actinomycetes bacterium]
MTPGVGRVVRVSGPLVEATGLPASAMAWMVELGERRLPGEVVAIDDDVVSVQAYDYTGGLRPGDPVTALLHPLSARLGPGLLGGVYDGLLRPLASAGVWLEPGSGRDTVPTAPVTFTPSVSAGDTVGPGAVLGTVPTGSLLHRVLVPPDVSGEVTELRPEGPCAPDDVVASVGGVEVPMTTIWPVRRPRPYAERLDGREPLFTGQRVLDVLFPVARGSTAAVPGGFGTGKTVLLQQVAKWCDADVIVYVGCGERGNEMADVLQELASLTDPRTGGRLVDRSVVIANTSNMPMMAREASVYSAVTVAEYYRDMGYDAVVIADSTSRWAEALRELASRTGALPAEEGYPAALSSALAAFYERAGRVRTVGGRVGSVTVIGAVSPAGGDMSEPVTAHTQRFVRSLWTLDRDLAYARHYPAVSWAGSFARDVDTLAAWHAGNGDPGWARRRARLAALLAEADRLTALAELLGITALPGHERMVMLAGRLLREGLLQQNAMSPVDAVSPAPRSTALIAMLLDVVDACLRLVEHGVPAASVEEVDFSPVLRAREEAGPDDIAAVEARRDEVVARLARLEPSP